MMRMIQNAKLQPADIGALILSPSRELCSQIVSVIQPFAEKLNLTVETVTGGQKVDKNIKMFKNKNVNILVATPGRLFQIIQHEKTLIARKMRTLQLLVIDEADRFNEIQFEDHMREILSCIPKQRRTGLFSATQVKEEDDLMVFGLRNAKQVKVAQERNSAAPSTLKNYYVECRADEKTSVCLEFIRQRTDKKILIFFPSCNSVRYFYKIFERCLGKRPLFAVHGKCSNPHRASQIKAFSDSTNGVMISTDVMARGIDISDIDWVIQFDLPKHSSWFVHRAGRTARCGREGNALILIASEQLAYVNFLDNHEKVKLDEIKVPTNNSRKSEELRQKMIKIQVSDRAILEAGTRAFVSHVESYAKHDCHLICSLDDLNVVGLANSYALLRLPKMRELSQRKDLDMFDRSAIETSEIKYADVKLEANRETVMKEKHEKKVETLAAKDKKRREKEARKLKKMGGRFRNGGGTGRKAEEKKALKRKAEEEDDAQNDIRLLKRIKRGKLSKKEIKDVL
ncbi:ATP-dependent RNA helicase [Caenorhabditis elegans]|nr:ATP-dependent RNA helicase [Caenorhabditis elegans]CCF23444.1 ATP-dependent RNA helicase [Caenorhabditis elegans]|eukprot:NP_001254981.1 RNA helicase [Caenorhabditis elegans]